MKLLRKSIQYILVALPVFLFFYFFIISIVDVPINDDYALLDFMNKYIESNSLYEKIKILFAQHNEHRIFYDRIFTLFSYEIFNKVNFIFLATIGNLSLIGICFIFYTKFVNYQKSIILFLPITILLFSLSSWENITFPMATLSNFSVLFFITLSIYGLTMNGKINSTNLIVSFLIYVLAVFTQGAGIFLIPISIFIFFIKKEYKILMIYVSLQLLILLAYFYDYKSFGNNKSIIDVLLTEKLAFLQFMFAFLGSASSYFLIFTENAQQSLLFSKLFGVLLFIFFLFITYKKYYKKNLFIYSLMSLIVISSVVTALSRVGNGLDTAVASRYRISSILFVITIYFWAIETINLKREKIFTYSTLSVSILFFYFISLNHYEYLDVRKRQTIYGVLCYNNGDISNLNGDKGFLDFYKETLNKSKQLKTYVLPNNEDLETDYPFSKKALIGNSTSTTARFLNVSIDNIKEIEDSFLIEGWAFLDGLNTKEQTIFIGLKDQSNNETNYFSANQILRYDLSPFFKKSGLSYGGFSARIKKNMIKNTTFRISVVALNKEEISFKETDKTLKKER